ncbi:MAG TPA: hypothetical protein VNZ26_13760 [Vicinamibacterales bacterium]|nr:hypothetical protein [Vicinamibacterales bacterium]
MTKLMLRTASLALALLIEQPGVLVHAQYNSTDSRQHGYEHGYRDGADRGRQDHERGLGHSFRDNDYLAGARDYDPAFGSRREYMSGYQEGYQAGYDDGYNYHERPGRYGELYGRRGDSSSRGGGGDRSSQRDVAPATRPSPGGYADAAFDAGYREGIATGQQDQRQNVRSDFRRSQPYRNGDAGYRSSFGDRNEYRQNFQDGFERGYQDGYGRSRYSSDGGGYFPNRDTTGAADTRDGEGTQSRTVIVPATRQWTPTTIRVNQGDRIRFETTGEIHWSANPNDRARAAGALDQKRTPGAPLPNSFAGALIGRIDGGQPFGIGDQTSIVIPASGLLYLGINDDNVSDNSGQFQVVISW